MPSLKSLCAALDIPYQRSTKAFLSYVKALEEKAPVVDGDDPRFDPDFKIEPVETEFPLFKITAAMRKRLAGYERFGIPFVDYLEKFRVGDRSERSTLLDPPKPEHVTLLDVDWQAVVDAFTKLPSRKTRRGNTSLDALGKVRNCPKDAGDNCWLPNEPETGQSIARLRPKHTFMGIEIERIGQREWSFLDGYEMWAETAPLQEFRLVHPRGKQEQVSSGLIYGDLLNNHLKALTFHDGLEICIRLALRAEEG